MLTRTLLVLLILGVPVAVSALDAETKAQEQTQEPKKKVTPIAKRPLRSIPVEPLPPLPEATSDPIEIFNRAAEASMQLGRVYYEANLTSSEPMIGGRRSLWATVVLGGRADGSIEKFRVMVPSAVPGPAGLITAMAGSDGKVFFLVDVKNKTVTESYDRGVISDMEAILDHVAVPEMVHADPFGTAKKAAVLEFKGEEAVNGIRCYVVHTSNADGTEQKDWYFNVRDALPRRVDWIRVDAEGRASTKKLLLEKMAANPSMMRDPFTKYIPEGYKVITSVPQAGAEKKTGQKTAKP